MRNFFRIVILLALTLPAAHADSDGNSHLKTTTQASSKLPLTSIFDSEGTRISLPQVTQNQPAVTILYRGSWCPYCIKHLKEIQENLSAFEAQGLKVVAISPDKPSNAKAMIQKYGFTFDVLSDPEMKLGNAFGMGFTLDQKTRDMLKSYEIDVEAASGFNHYQLPHPAVFISDAQNNIVFTHSNPDYKQRMSAKKILTAANKILN